MNKFRYWLEEEGSCNDYYEIETPWSDDQLEYVAQCAARDFWDDRDGKEWPWPIQIVIADDMGEQLGTFSVDVEQTATFAARKVGAR